METQHNKNLTGKNEDTGLPIAGSFQARFLAVNHLEGSNFKEWLFAPGMLFSARGKWWGNGGDRTAPHEGIDLKYYRTVDGRTNSIGPGMKIPVIFPGRVAVVIDDFLGKSVFIRHPQFHRMEATLFSAYGHTQPEPEIQEGVKLEEDIIGTIADKENSRRNIPPHLHISVAWIADNLLAKDFSWKKLSEPGISIFVDPLFILKIQYNTVADIPGLK
jgi:hypothetical protein